jgi:transcriptional regulator with XRE-family HTH domain
MKDENKHQHQPFAHLGDTLRELRQRHKESVAEVSGAVEIDEQTLVKIEQGHERPTEDILMLLISHFGMHEDEAAGLWQLAGYDKQEDDASQPQTGNKTMVMIMAVDPRVVYSDGVQVVANGSGVVMNFAQSTGTPQALVTARVGMSREQAGMVLKALQVALHPAAPRQLPPGNSAKN